jgi:hypothetical protein
MTIKWNTVAEIPPQYRNWRIELMKRKYFNIKIEIVEIQEDVITASSDFGPGQYDNTADDVYGDF